MRTFEQILANTNTDLFSEMVLKTYELKQLNNLFCRFLSADIANHCRLAKIEDNVLHVVVDGAVWGARLRYAIPDILKNLKLQPEFKGVDKIKYHIDIELEAPSRKLQKNKISDVNEQLWRQAILDLKNRK